jgi:hypothetical protein
LVVAPAFAYGKDNWQIGFSGTGVFPSTGQGFGFWGWCAFGGDVTSAMTAIASSRSMCMAHRAAASPAMRASISRPGTRGGTFVIKVATVTVTPSSLTGPCLAFFPSPGGFPVDTGFPAAAGHYNLGGIGGERGEFQIQVSQIP